MSWSDKADPVPPTHPERGHAMPNIKWSSLAIGVAIGYFAAAYLPKWMNR